MLNFDGYSENWSIIFPNEAEWYIGPMTFLQVWGMGCANCANKVRKSRISQNEVIEAIVQHTIGLAQIAFNPQMITVDGLISAVVAAGGDGRHEYAARCLNYGR